MEYPDFEFWFYRFYHGELDFDYDRSADPEPKTIMDMPVKLMRRIAEHVDPVGRSYLRSMNHAIKSVTDSLPPTFENIEIVVWDTSLSWTLNKQFFSCNNKCFEEFTSVLKKPNLQVNRLSLQIYEETTSRDDILPMPFNAKSVFIYGQTTNQVVELLSAMTPRYLESISLDGMYSIEREDYSMIFETDQFKKAKSIKFPLNMEFNVEDLVNFSNLKSFKCQLRSENTFEDVPRIRDILSTFEELESCELDYYVVSDGSKTRVFAMALGAEIPIEPLAPFERLTITHRYQIPESNECLEFKLKDESLSCRVNIVKIRC
ncbi:hypothetical protein B9Z55_027026 [Caenorhabditis nigoni]|nr:hypothetical protein B9Z55_027026 [Caenorhabditis nigoni]